MGQHVRFYHFILITTLLSCQQPKEQAAEKTGDLFTILGPEKTGVAFRNDLQETLYMNGLFYEYFYNGAGVAVGDFNNDQLPDIYFVSNLKANELYLNRGDLQFQEVGQAAGVAGKAGFPTGVTTVDINGDGLLDIYICASGKFRDPERRRNELYINQGPDTNGLPRFTEQAADYGLDLEELSTQAAFFDYDRDGDLDMFLLNHDVDIYGDDKLEEYLNTPGPLSGERLYRNDDGQFINVTRQAGIIDNRLSYGLGLAVGDVNNDQWPDIYVGHDFSGEDHLYLNNGDGTFTEQVKESMRHISNFSMGNDLADINNDGRLDIMAVDMVSEDNYGIKTSMSGMNPNRFFHHVELGLHHQYMFNTLQLNNGVTSDGDGPYFSEIAHLAGVSNTDWSWAPLFFDMDLDGDKDMFIGNGIKRDFRNNDFVNYHKQVRAELAQQKEIDREAYINDVMARMPERKKTNYFFRNNGDLTFSKLNGSWIEPLTCSNGAAYADFDNDGDLDMVVNNMDDYAFIYRNNSRERKAGAYLAISLQGTEKNRLGIGARVIIDDGERIQTLEHQPSRGFQSSVAPGLHAGLGDTRKINRIEIIWPDGNIQVLTGVKANQQLVVRYEDSDSGSGSGKQPESPLFQVSKTIDYRHRENTFDDFDRESLLPHRMSRFGPALATGDVNGDGREDVFIGGALSYPGALYLQDADGQFLQTQQDLFAQDRSFEDTGAALFDADGDGDLDLYVVSGGNERPPGSNEYQDRFYENVDGTLQRRASALPAITISGSCVQPFDYDGDGDLDLFVGGRQTPGRYPYPTSSLLLRNDSEENTLSFDDVTSTVAPALTDIGMVTDAIWTNITGEGGSELILSGEWMPLTILQYRDGRFENITEELGLEEETGWWFSVTAADFDRDGDIDLVGGNLGLNYKYKASPAEPFEIYANDFDESGNIDIVLGYYNQGDLYPLRGRECSSNQMPFIKEKFPTYDAYGKATLEEVYEPEKLAQSIHYQAHNFGTTYFENLGNGAFTKKVLDNYAQFSSTNVIIVQDFNGDRHLDLLLAGNLYSSEVETARNDAGYGVYLEGNGRGEFTVKRPFESGLFLHGDIKAGALIQLANGERGIIFAANNDAVQLVKIVQPVL
jgi:hypothetical protein